MRGLKVTAIVLAGGGSSRMGFNKALMKLGEETVIERTVKPLLEVFEEVMIITDTPEVYSFLKGVAFYSDAKELKERNSMIGIYTGLLRAKYPKAFVVACDMPLISKKLLIYMKQQLHDEDILIPVVNGFYEPLHAFYSKSCLPVFEDCINREKFKVTAAFQGFKIKTVDEEFIRVYDKELQSFININTIEEYQRVCEMLRH